MILIKQLKLLSKLSKTTEKKQILISGQIFNE